MFVAPPLNVMLAFPVAMLVAFFTVLLLPVPFIELYAYTLA